MKHVILFRKAFNEHDEEMAARRHFQVYNNRNAIPSAVYVVGRYSVLPFYKEYDEDLRLAFSIPINTFAEHSVIADVMAWAPILGDMTPKTWDRLSDVPDDTPLILKGQTNSRKDKWRTHMFAPDKREAIQVMLRLQDDGLIGSQKIYIRKYEPLVHLIDEGLGGMPISEEYRFFVLDSSVVASGFYWASHVDDLDDGVRQVPGDMFAFVGRAIDKLRAGGFTARFFVIDVARKADGSLMVVELNDAQMSGLSCIDPDEFYSNLKTLLSK